MPRKPITENSEYLEYLAVIALGYNTTTFFAKQTGLTRQAFTMKFQKLVKLELLIKKDPPKGKKGTKYQVNWEGWARYLLKGKSKPLNETDNKTEDERPRPFKLTEQEQKKLNNMRIDAENRTLPAIGEKLRQELEAFFFRRNDFQKWHTIDCFTEYVYYKICDDEETSKSLPVDTVWILRKNRLVRKIIPFFGDH